MAAITILTPDPADPSYAGQWPTVLERLTRALALEGISARPTPWTDHIEDAAGLKDEALVLPVLVWGYHRDHARWMKACATWSAAGLRMLNPAPVIGWNSDKAYLGRLADKGVSVPRTIWLDQATPDNVAEAFDTLGADTVVVKPRVSGGAWKTLRLNRGEPLTEAPEGPAMVQAYLPSIETEGETSLLFFGGRFSHAVRKTPVPGDFRIQVQFGGRYETVTPPPDALALAERTLAAIDEDLLYARIDLTREGARDGDEWRLMEAELIEPDFYLSNAPDDGAAFARAVRDRLG